MKRLLYILPLVAVLLSGCKEDNWMDWKLQNEMWLEANAHNDSVKTSPSGLQYIIINPGNTTDTKPDDISTVIVDYKGHLINGYEFDAADAASLQIASVVDGFAEGMKKIHVHGTIELYIPQELGYKDKAQGTEGSLSVRYIPPYSTLIFWVHINAVSR